MSCSTTEFPDPAVVRSTPLMTKALIPISRMLESLLDIALREPCSVPFSITNALSCCTFTVVFAVIDSPGDEVAVKALRRIFNSLYCWIVSVDAEKVKDPPVPVDVPMQSTMLHELPFTVTSVSENSIADAASETAKVQCEMLHTELSSSS